VSWDLRKSGVSLRVAKFAPDVDRPVAGLTAEQRAEHQARRRREQSKAFLKDGALSRNGRFRWSAGWGSWVPVEPVREETRSNLPLESFPDPAHVCNDMNCTECWNKAQLTADYMKNRGLWGNGGL
jgi:hypothetical protein